MAKRSTKPDKKPIRRPRSAYNLFYKHQRSIILQELSTSTSSSTCEDMNILPKECTTLLLAIDGEPKRRKHRKTHGMINLQELTKKIAKRWKELKPDTKKQYQDLAKQDAARYREELSTYEMAMSQKDEYSPRPIEEMLKDTGVGIMSRMVSKTHSEKEVHFTCNDVSYFMDILMEVNFAVSES